MNCRASASMRASIASSCSGSIRIARIGGAADDGLVGQAAAGMLKLGAA